MRSGAICSVLLLWSLSGHCDENETQHFDAFPYYVDSDEDRGVAGRGAGLRGAFGWILRDQWSAELQGFASVLETDLPGGTDYYQLGVGTDLVRSFGQRSRVHPFALVGVGAVYDDVLPDRDDSINPFVNAALGIASGGLTESGLRLRGEVRYIYDVFDSDRRFGDWHVGIGLSVPLGRVRERIVEVERERVVIKEVPLVTVTPPPADNDRDGVVDSQDDCPNTLPNASVDRRGCMRGAQTITLQGVHFEYASAILTEHARRTLEGVARALYEQPDVLVEIAGHTDGRGSDTYNLNLSRSRAESVRDYLVRPGVENVRLRANGYGESQPVASNDTEAGRALNRRVELRVRGNN
ncbi:MAG TPA: OmpA family protein [Steroidobacter sp.]|uniref:OmpA family protein n=1 Tax=Steroidobacter sp. TaxID=1978227 RepID=UPI002ED9F6B1